MENIKNILRNFAQFYGQECWQNGRQGIRELPSGEEFIDIYAKELIKTLNKPDVIKSVCEKCRFKAECRYKEMNTEQNCKYFIDEQTVL